MPAKAKEGLFIIDISGLGLSHKELLAIEKEINQVVMARLKEKPELAKRKFMRPPGPPMGLWEGER
jgi:hypothetical protein